MRQFLTRRIVAVHEGDGPPNASKAWIMAELLKTLGHGRRPRACKPTSWRAWTRCIAAGEISGRPAGWTRGLCRAVAAASMRGSAQAAEELAVLFGEEQVARRDCTPI